MNSNSRALGSAHQLTTLKRNNNDKQKQESPSSILNSCSDPSTPRLTTLAQLNIKHTDQGDEKCECVTQYFHFSTTG